MHPEPADEFVRSLNQPEIDFVIIADRAEVVGGKLYLMGGGYDRILLKDEPPHAFTLSFAVGVMVPWNACNQEHRITFAVEDAEGKDIGFTAEVGFNVGRHPSMAPGESQRVMIAPPQAAVAFPGYGTYFLRVTLNGVSHKKEAIYVRSLSPARAG